MSFIYALFRFKFRYARIYMYMLFSVYDALFCINQIDSIKIL